MKFPSFRLFPLGVEGLGLLDGMMAIGLTTGAALLAAQLVKNQNQQMGGNRLIMTRDQQRFLVERYAGDPKALLVSAVGNKQLSACIHGNDPDGCQAEPTYFKLKDPTGTDVVAGLDDPTEKFDTEGRPCTSGPKCVLESLSRFTGDCGGAASCVRAQRITVEYTIRQREGVFIAGAAKLSPITRKVTTNVDLIVALGERYCPPGRVMIGIRMDGTLNCKAVSCESGFALQKIEDDWTPKCVPVDVPEGTMAYFHQAVCPTGWSPVPAAQGRYVVAIGTAGSVGGVNGTPLTDLEDRAVGKHKHDVDDPGHVHTYMEAQTVPGPGAAGAGTQIVLAPKQTQNSKTDLVVKEEGTVGGTNAPYIQLLMCKRDG